MIRIRPSTLLDLPGLMRVENECFSTPWSEKSMRSFLDQPDLRICLTAEECAAGSEVVGYLALQYVGDEAEICNIAVNRDLRGQGIGGMLIDSAVRFCARKSVSSLHLEVRRGNRSAIALYTKKGFRPIGVRRGYYQDTGEDALLYVKEINAKNDFTIDSEVSDPGSFPASDFGEESACGR